MKNDTTVRTKQEMEAIKGSRDSRIMFEEEWLELKECISELTQGSSAGSFLDKREERYQK